MIGFWHGHEMYTHLAIKVDRNIGLPQKFEYQNRFYLARELSEKRLSVLIPVHSQSKAHARKGIVDVNEYNLIKLSDLVEGTEFNLPTTSNPPVWATVDDFLTDNFGLKVKDYGAYHNNLVPI
ncbi:hypothetical protein HN789_07120 [archaeon]|jgi:hypothetical protein|nr:hypothetical protein [archaeon]MBT4021754.1 hypothetical protein [archaeon]MBT4271831.1 hypothetical protein [archaeon]MBT4460474.1 hypothetical protein [archaeon]MBT4858494.1 hypothetical protein [archaeon]